MDFFKFKINNEKCEYNLAVAKLIHSINLVSQGYVDIGFRLERIDGALVCTLYTDDNKIKDSLTRLPILLNKIERISPGIRFDMACGYKYINGVYPTALTMWLCGYLSEDIVKEKTLFGAQNLLNDKAIKYFEYCNRQPVTFLINDDVYKIKDKAYYPIMFCHSPLTQKRRVLDNLHYTKDLRSIYNCFYKAAYETFVKQKPDSVFKTDYCGNKTILTRDNRKYEELPYDENIDENIADKVTNKMLCLTKN